MKGNNDMLEKMKRYRFLFSELVKRDFKKKYKRTVLGMVWSILAPLLNVLVLQLVFSNFFGRNDPTFIIYIFSGTLVMSFYTEATQGCMRGLMANASIFTKVNVPKVLFLLSKAVQSFINFGLTLLLYFLFCIVKGMHFGWETFTLVYPIFMLLLLNIGVGMILSALFVFFRDIEYLYSVFLVLLNYVSAIFYPLTILPQQYRRLFYANPVFVYIKYFRMVMMDGVVPGLPIQLLCAFYALFFLAIGCLIYKRYNHEFLYYL